MSKPRRDLTPREKALVHAEAAGVCELCGNLVPVEGAGVQYDHRLQRWFDPDRLDDLKNMRPVHVRCHLLKTARDATVRAKTKRQEKMTPFTERAPSKMRSAGFRKDIRRRMNGRVEKR